MKTFNCPKCGSDQVGTLEKVPGCARVLGVNDDGTFAYEGETVMWWDDSETLVDDDEEPRLCCAYCGEEFALADCTLVEAEPEPPAV